MRRQQQAPALRQASAGRASSGCGLPRPFPPPLPLRPPACQALVPNMDSALLSLALDTCQYDADRAAVMLRRFQVRQVPGGSRVRRVTVVEEG